MQQVCGSNGLDEALADFNKAIELNPRDPDAWNNRGLVYDRLGRQDEALFDFSRAIEIDDFYGKGYNNRGRIYIKLGRTAEADEDLKKAARLGVKEAKDYLDSRGIAYAIPNRFEVAVSYFRYDYKEDFTPLSRVRKRAGFPR